MPCQSASESSCKSPLVKSMPRAAQYVCTDIHFWMEKRFEESAEAAEEYTAQQAGSKAMSRMTISNVVLNAQTLAGILNWQMGEPIYGESGYRDENGDEVHEYGDITNLSYSLYEQCINRSNPDHSNNIELKLRAQFDETQEKVLWSFGLKALQDINTTVIRERIGEKVADALVDFTSFVRKRCDEFEGAFDADTLSKMKERELKKSFVLNHFWQNFATYKNSCGAVRSN